MIYSQLFLTLQHQCMMAGIPYDLLNADALTDVTNIVGYDALVIPLFSHVPADLYAKIMNTLQEAVFGHGMGIITSGDFMTRDENGTLVSGDSQQSMKLLLGLERTGSMPRHPLRQLQIVAQRLRGALSRRMENALLKNEGTRHLVRPFLGFLSSWVRGPIDAVTVTAADVHHPIMKNYTSGEIFLKFEQGLRFNHYNGLPDRPADILAEQTIFNETYPAVLSTETGGRNIHFANWEIMGCSNLLWQALQWTVYGHQTPVGLNLGRNRTIFIPRCDLDRSREPREVISTEVALYDTVARWKEAYDFVGSFYINIGNDPDRNFYTDWGISEPLYRKYLALGNEIGTHSYTHPFSVWSLTPAELDFEFFHSRKEIEDKLNIYVSGAAIPGGPENLYVIEIVAQCFDYLSGNVYGLGSGYPLAAGYLSPETRMIYVTPNMDSDYTLLWYRGWDPPQAESHWLSQYTQLTCHAFRPIIHWPWHDYAATDTTVTAGGIHSSLVERACMDGAEFATAADMHDRIRSFRDARLEVDSGDPELITATVTLGEETASLGTFSLTVHTDPDRVIESVSNWYAFEGTTVFLPRRGGRYSIQLGIEAAPVTHIISLPMRAELISVTGNGTELEFLFHGEGNVIISLHGSLEDRLVPVGADSTTVHGNVLEMIFEKNELHRGAIVLSDTR